ncbi:DUF3486 family protein [Devosia sp.]|uniref:DUF3486 family protein n=1 Tax=Devosia sp. TaxID=1871048 RepID=UPI001AD089A2|nr:DUF3486 family protein [Devosia sp.]MBN9334702.1 DUF3486 family protein [Devosia sp.]
MAKGRGRLSSIDLLPIEAADDVLWANQELYARQRPITDILAEFNERLEAKGIEQISRTAFYNRSMRIAAAQTRMRQAREMFEGLSSEFTAEDVDENTVILGEFIKTLIQELVDDSSGRRSPKDAMELARAYQATVAAQKMSTDRRLKLQAELADKTEEVVREVGKTHGWSEETVDDALAKVLGVEVKRK